MVMYSFCFLGELFNDLVSKFRAKIYKEFRHAKVQLKILSHYLQCEMFRNSVYFTPWYHTTPKQRKDIYIFLCQAQHTRIQFFAFKIFPFRMAAFPSSLRFAYSLANVFLNRGKK